MLRVKLRRVQSFQWLSFLTSLLFCSVASGAEWSAIDGVDVREVSNPDGLEFRPVDLPDKFVTGRESRGELRAISNGLVSYRWKPAVSNCAAMGVTVSTAGTAWALGAFQSGAWQALGSVGVVSKTASLAAAGERARVVSLESLSAGPCILYMVVSNHHYGQGGLWRAPVLKAIDEAESEQRRGQAVAILVFSILVFTGVYHFMLGSLKGHDEASRYFAFLSLILALRQGASGLGVLDVWITRDASWSYSFFQHAAFLVMPLVPFCLNRYIHALFEDLLPDGFLKVCDWIFGAFVLYWSFAPLVFFDRALLPFHICVVVYAFFILGRFLAHWSRGDWLLRAWVLTIAFLTLGAFLDIAMIQLGFGDQFLLSYCFMGFIGMQSYLIARRLDGYLSESQALAASLKESLDERERVEGKLHEMEDKLDDYAQELKLTGEMLVQSQKLAGLGELVASIGHDISNPLHSLQLGLDTRESREAAILEAIQSILDDSEDAQAFLGHLMPQFDALSSERDTARVSLERLNALSMALRRSARLDAELEVFDLHQVMKDSLLITAHRLKALELSVEMTSYGILLGHASHVGQVFTNLLTNAADAIGEESKGQLRVRISDEEHDGKLFIGIRIEDSGSGIPEEIMEKVVEIFFTTKPSGKGTGLGLAITKRVLDEHEGTMVFSRSEELGGACVHLLFPRRDEVRTLSASPVVSKG